MLKAIDYAALLVLFYFFVLFIVNFLNSLKWSTKSASLPNIIKNIWNSISSVFSNFTDYIQHSVSFLQTTLKNLLGLANYIPYLIVATLLLTLFVVIIKHSSTLLQPIKKIISACRKFLELYSSAILSIVYSILGLSILGLIALQMYPWITNYFGKDKNTANTELSPPKLSEVQFSCRDSFPIWSYGGVDSVEVNLNKCHITFPAGVDICEYGTLISIGMSSANGPNDKEKIRAKNRGDTLARHMLKKYQYNCPSIANKPKVYVLNLGQPTDTNQDNNSDRILKAYVGSSIENKSQLSKQLKNEIHDQIYSHWELSEFSYGIN